MHQVGAGTLGPVFRAYDADRARLVAVKVLRLDQPPQRLYQLVAELERLIAAELTHPIIAAPIATGTDGLVIYLAQEYVPADSLDVVLRDEGRPAPDDAIRVAAQLAEALDYAAAAGIWHGVLHPRDVLIAQDDTRLTGLGVAGAIEKIGVAAPRRRPYTAPERMAGAAWDRRADVFSLAALIHEMLWGRRLAAAGSEAADALTDLPGSNPAALKAAFTRALAVDPADRFETAREFSAALAAAFPHLRVAPDLGGHGGRRRPESTLPLILDPAYETEVRLRSDATHERNTTNERDAAYDSHVMDDQEDAADEKKSRNKGAARRLEADGTSEDEENGDLDSTIRMRSDALEEIRLRPAAAYDLEDQDDERTLQLTLDPRDEEATIQMKLDDDATVRRSDSPHDGDEHSPETLLPFESELGSSFQAVPEPGDHGRVQFDDRDRVQPDHRDRPDERDRPDDRDHDEIAQAGGAKAAESSPPVPDTDDLELHPSLSAAYAEVELAPAARVLEPVEPAPTPEPALRPAMFQADRDDSRELLVAGDDPVEPARSLMLPVAAALLVGLALGFGGGYVLGGRRSAPAVAATPGAVAPPQSATAAPPGREFTEAAVVDAKPAQPAPAQSPSAAGALSTKGLPSARGQARSGRAGDRADAATNGGAAAAAAAEATGRLLVRSTPAGARVSVDGRDEGPTPATIRDLPRGTHRIRISRDGYVAEERRIAVTAAQPSHSITLELKRTGAAAAARPAGSPAAPEATGAASGTVTVDSRPDGASVFLDGKLVGTTPLSLPDVAPGEHTVRMERDGYRQWESSVRVAGGQRQRVAASLER